MSLGVTGVMSRISQLQEQLGLSPAPATDQEPLFEQLRSAYLHRDDTNDWANDSDTGGWAAALRLSISAAAASQVVRNGRALEQLPAVAAAPIGAALAGPPYRVAVTFDAAAVASWLHTDGAGTAPTASLATSGTFNLRSRF